MYKYFKTYLLKHKFLFFNEVLNILRIFVTNTMNDYTMNENTYCNFTNNI